MQGSSCSLKATIAIWGPWSYAITSLNGSKESSILDAICFLLDLTNLHSARTSLGRDPDSMETKILDLQKPLISA
jgi:hypothetical protein